MSDNKKYYYMKLKENFFESDEMIVLESMPDGYLYTNILLKLYLRSLKDSGRLMFKGLLPYTPDVLARVVRHNIGVVEKAIQIFKQLGLVEILDNGAIYMLDIQNFIGESSTEADRIRAYRKQVDEQKKLTAVADVKANVRTNVVQMYDKSTPEIELEIDREIEREKDKNTVDANASTRPNKRFQPPDFDDVQAYCNERQSGVDAEHWYDYYSSNGWKVGKNAMKDWKAAVRTWERNNEGGGKSRVGQSGKAAYQSRSVRVAQSIDQLILEAEARDHAAKFNRAEVNQDVFG